MKYQVIIPMTGVGQRFIDAGYKELKPLISVAGKPIIEHVLNMFSDAEKVVCIVSSDHEQKKALISEIYRIRQDATISEISGHKLGPGYAIVQASKDIDLNLPTLVSYCDWAGIWNVNEILNQLKIYSGSILTYTGFHPHMMRSNKFAYVRKLNDLVIDIQEKSPYTNEPMEEEASAGCYGFSTGLFLLESLSNQIKENHSHNGEFYISLTYKNILQKKYKVGTVLMKKFFQWGTPEDIEDWEYWKNSINALPGSLKEKLHVNNVILAAGRGTRIAKITKVTKPNLMIAGQCLWEYSAPKGISFNSSLIVTRDEIGIVNRNDVKQIKISQATEGQAVTAKIGIKHIDEHSNGSVNVLSSDNAFTPEIFAKAQELIENFDIIVWTSRAYPLARLNPKHYGWINLSHRKIIQKNKPINFQEWELITGNFTFGNKDIAISLIDELIEKNIQVNNEFYLDSAIVLAFKRNLKIATLEVENFMAVGTPEEFLTYKFFSGLE